MNKSILQIIIENVFLTVFSIVKILLLSYKVSFKKTKSRNTHCLIMGNGPSLKDSLKRLDNSIKRAQIFCVNHFAETDIYNNIKPKNYIINAPELWLTNVEQHHRERGIRLFEAIVKNTEWDLNLYIPFSARKYKRWKNIILENKHIKIYYFNNTPVEGFEWFINFVLKKSWGLPRPHNVLIPSIAIACNIGFRTIFIIGAENSFFKEIIVSNDNQVFLTHKHFYDSENVKNRPMHNLGRGSRKIHEILQKFVYSFKGYWVLRNYADKNGIKIFNATPDSFIDAFKRKELDNLLIEDVQ